MTAAGLVSVVVPTHDRARLVTRAVRSVLAQEGADVEVVVVDDGSSDGTAAAVAALGSGRVRTVRHDVARGVAAARNRGVAEARGEWVAFLDDDDLWAPTKLRSQLAAATSAGAAWCYTGAVAVDESLDVLSGGRAPDPAELAAALPYRNAVPGGSSNVVVRADHLRAAGPFDESLRHLADWDLWIRVARGARAAAVAAPLVAYVQHPANASLDTPAIAGEMRVVEDRYRDLRGGRPVDRAYVWRWIAWSSLRAGDRRGALAAYARAVAAGDVTSLARAVVGTARPSVARAPRTPPSDPWRRAAEAWLAAYRP